tara:strand:- start:121 stop:567 length:447 start_codon:yes stop_codon:yes gene_type:complete
MSNDADSNMRAFNSNMCTEVSNEKWESRKIYTELNEEQFKAILHDTANTHIFIKFSASWCKPCNLIKTACDTHFATLPKDAIIVDINIDDTLDLYSVFKRKKMLNGIPTILYYNTTETRDRWFIPDDSVSGGDVTEVARFFKRCMATT